MLYDGDFVKAQAVQDGIYELIFDNKRTQFNTLSQATLKELRVAVDAVGDTPDACGLLVTSTKADFILGADVTEFPAMVAMGSQKLKSAFADMNGIFNALEDLPFPTVAAINGQALGGGCEVCVALDFRVLSSRAKVGFPEVNLGIVPGWGGTVRLPRMIGAENALEWICTAKIHSAAQALAVGVADAVVEEGLLREAALDLLRRAHSGELEYRNKRQAKQSPLTLNDTESLMAFESAKALVAAKAGPHYPAPVAAAKLIERAAGLQRDDALVLETEAFVELGQTDVHASLLGLFLNNQFLKKKAKKVAASAAPVTQAAVLGAGIMGGGIAYQSALKGVPVVMKDIKEEALQIGLDEATKQLSKRVSKGRLDAAGMAKVISTIRPTLDMRDLANVDVAIEAVVENPDVKLAVLKELEATVDDQAIIASNTSTISINQLATALEKPERFCGMHFFNPVPLMPLVEVIRGEQTSDETVARVVAYAARMGKSPIVVNDCPGFLINRVLFPYLHGFNLLINDGADYQQVDQVMERFGWPMGPAYLQDVVGIDTCHHAVDVMAKGFPERMTIEADTILDQLYNAQWYGQKNGKGFYLYEVSKKGKPQKLTNPELGDMLDKVRSETKSFTPDEIIIRMMLPLCLETVRCLDEGIVASAAEADMGQIMGIGFPQFRGGALRYIDTLGADAIVAHADRCASLGALYEVPTSLREMAAAGKKFFGG